ncbi:hypothetical protein MKY14_01745 [Paenibacillus sp. FSL R5-0887]|uniref:hypothetical protein n=1 Tax=Paenibacillus sp. FSL R5-0887 TaxID=2921662 RepID=UPI0030FC88CB
MKISVRRRLLLAGQSCFLLLLCIGLIATSSGSSSALAASRVSVVDSVTQDLIPLLRMDILPSPGTVQEFAKSTLNKLAAEAPFTAWKDAGIEYYPLGPGTHSWLVNVMKGEQRIGYMIISATDQGGYMLSEYGAGTYGLPYSLLELRQFLVQEGLIPSSYTGKIKLTALYAPLLPVWKIVIDDKTIFINASVPQVLPWTLSKAEEVLKGQQTETDVITNLTTELSPLSAYQSGGTDDPYKNIMWLTSPKLIAVGGDNIAALIRPKESIAYQAAGRNDIVGAPFMITGYQNWLPASNKTQAINNIPTVYAASGPEGRRYLPLTSLQAIGTLHKLPDKNIYN